MVRQPAMNRVTQKMAAIDLIQIHKKRTSPSTPTPPPERENSTCHSSSTTSTTNQLMTSLPLQQLSRATLAEIMTRGAPPTTLNICETIAFLSSQKTYLRNRMYTRSLAVLGRDGKMRRCRYNYQGGRLYEARLQNNELDYMMASLTKARTAVSN